MRLKIVSRKVVDYHRRPKCPEFGGAKNVVFTPPLLGGRAISEDSLSLRFYNSAPPSPSARPGFERSVGGGGVWC